MPCLIVLYQKITFNLTERERERGILLDLNISVKKFHLISQLEFETYIANFGLVR